MDEKHCECRKPRLTPRERQVMDCLVNGVGNKVVAFDLGISIRTVEVHRARVFSKLGVRNLVELIQGLHAGRFACCLGTSQQTGLSGRGQTPAASKVPLSGSEAATRPLASLTPLATLFPVCTLQEDGCCTAVSSFAYLLTSSRRQIAAESSPLWAQLHKRSRTDRDDAQNSPDEGARQAKKGGTDKSG